MKSSAAVVPAHINYGKAITGEEKLTVRLYLDRTNRKVILSCLAVEALSHYKSREVVFDANFKCTILFKNDVFCTKATLLSDRGFQGVSALPLEPNKPKSLFVAVDKGEPELNVRAKISDTEEILTGDQRMPPILRIP